MPRLLTSLFLTISLVAILAAQSDSNLDLESFEKGSHERFYEAFESSGETYYKEVVDSYRDISRSALGTAQIAIEWCEFISYFTYSEEFYFETAEKDYEEAENFLNQRYGRVPQVVLYKLKNKYGEEFFEEAQRIETETARWSQSDIGEYHLQIAQRHYWNNDLLNGQISAKRAYTFSPTTESALVLLNIYHDLGKKEESIEIVDTGTFDDATDWQKKQVMDILFSFDKSDQALEIYSQIKDSEDLYFDKFALANILASQDEASAGRELLEEIEISEWNEQSTLLNRLKFEFDHGTKESIWKAYEAYRALGWDYDPLSRMWFEISMKYDSYSSFGYAFTGFLFLFGLIIVGILSPLLIILPAHYWYLRKKINGSVEATVLGPWDLRSLWLCLAIMIVFDISLLWAANEYSLPLFFFDELDILNQIPLISDIRFIQLEFVLYSLLFGIMFWRIGGFKTLGSGEWSIPKSIGLGAALFVPIRMLSGIHSAIFEDLSYTISQSNILTSSLFQELLDAYGFWGLLIHVGLLGPLFEELIFRGLILGAIAKRIPFWAANLTQSVLFSLIHEDLRLIVFYICFGLLCGWLTQRSKGLLGAISLHALNNSLVCIGLYAMSHIS